jgi:putative ABC transport system permease protein
MVIPEWRYYSISLNTNNLEKTISSIQHTFKGLFPTNPFAYFFQDDFFNEQYKSDQRFAKIFNQLKYDRFMFLNFYLFNI